MINSESRAAAIQISAGENPHAALSHDQGSNKIYAYGVLASALSRVELPTPAEILESSGPCSVSGVTSALNTELKNRCNMVLKEDAALLHQLDRVVDQRNMDLYGMSESDPARRSLYGGVNTAMDIETTTLATVHARTNAGEQMTRRGLHKSQRVPFAFAVQSIAKLDTSDEQMFQRVWIEDAGTLGSMTNEKVLRPGVAEMDPHHGLTLAVNIPEPERPKIRFANEPTIGCPVTLVKNMIRDIHVVAADTCVEAGIIRVVE